MTARRCVAAVAAIAAVMASMAVAAQSAHAGSSVLTTYQSLPPTRLLDTRTGLGNGGVKAPVRSGQYIALAVAGRGGVPTTGVTAVVLNVAITNPVAAGNATVWADGQREPTASNLNYLKGQTVANLVTAPVGSNGKVDIGVYAQADVIADVSGYYIGGVADGTPGAFGSLGPQRLLDTRSSTPVPSGQHVALTVVGVAGVPATGVSAVVLNVTVTRPAGAGNATVWADGTAKPSTSNLNYVAGQTVPNLVVAPVGADGKIDIGVYTRTDVIADIEGYFLGGAPSAPGTLGVLPPKRLLDTRYGIGAPKAQVGSGRHVVLPVSGHGGVPSAGVLAVVLNVTVTNPIAAGNATVWADGAPQPAASNVNYAKGQTVPNLVMAPVGADGSVDIGVYAQTDLIADVFGYVVMGTPLVSTSHYVRNIIDADPSGDAATMNAEGCADARANTAAANYVTVLDIGAQTKTSPPTSPTNPGVALSATNPVVRLTYPNLVTALTGYLDGYASPSCHSGAGTATVVVATSSSGDWSTDASGYLAADRGSDWWSQVISPLNTHALTEPVGMTVVAGMDAEANFGTLESDVQTWMTSYLTASGSTAQVVDIGSADGCPTVLGQIGQTCGAVAGQSGTWTQQEYYTLAHGLSPQRILALPQIYSGALAVQWANIDQTGATATDSIDFIGVLTEHSACVTAGGCTSITPAVAFDAFTADLSSGSFTAPTQLRVATDLKVN